jgi:hypothetical protein
MIGESVIVVCSKLLGRKEYELFEARCFEHSTVEGSRPHLWKVLGTEGGASAFLPWVGVVCLVVSNYKELMYVVLEVLMYMTFTRVRDAQ